MKNADIRGLVGYRLHCGIPCYTNPMGPNVEIFLLGAMWFQAKYCSSSLLQRRQQATRVLGATWSWRPVDFSCLCYSSLAVSCACCLLPLEEKLKIIVWLWKDSAQGHTGVGRKARDKTYSNSPQLCGGNTDIAYLTYLTYLTCTIWWVLSSAHTMKSPPHSR